MASALLCFAATGAFAQPAADAPLEKKKVISIVVYGDDPCPKGESDEIVVCARQPESERYRVPKDFRKKQPEPKQRSWRERAEITDEATKATRPNSCSAVGATGQTGCTSEMLRAWKAEQRAKKQAEREAAETP